MTNTHNTANVPDMAALFKEAARKKKERDGVLITLGEFKAELWPSRVTIKQRHQIMNDCGLTIETAMSQGSQIPIEAFSTLIYASFLQQGGIPRINDIVSFVTAEITDNRNIAGFAHIEELSHDDSPEEAADPLGSTSTPDGSDPKSSTASPLSLPDTGSEHGTSNGSPQSNSPDTSTPSPKGKTKTGKTKTG